MERLINPFKTPVTGENPLAIRGIAFVEYAAPSDAAAEQLHKLFGALGFSRTDRHTVRPIDLYTQGQMAFLVNREPVGFAADFAKAHGPSIPGMAWWVDDAQAALKTAVERGARAYEGPIPYEGTAIYGIGDSLLFFVEHAGDADIARAAWRGAFDAHPAPVSVPSRGFTVVDHLTNNVQKGTMEHWQNFYKDVFGFVDVRTFDIDGAKTGLTSYALRSPCGTFCIPINEGKEDKSQIEEYLREYDGAGIQHIALLSDDLLGSLDGLAAAGVDTLDIDDEYYGEVFDRVPGVTEDHGEIQTKQVLVDGDDDGYLLQIFTKNVIGPIFFEMIQRKNHNSFGEGNFGALFRSIERDQERRGVL